MIADRERRMKYKKQEEDRESVRQNLRDKVILTVQSLIKCPPFVSHARTASTLF